MESVYIDRRDTALEVSGSALIVRHPDEPRALSLPLQNLQRVVLASRVTLSTTVLQACSRAGVALVVLNTRAPDVCTVTLPWTHGHAARRVAQYRMLGEASSLLDASRNLVRFKIAGQRRTLLRLLRNHPDARRAVTRSYERLSAADDAANSASDVASLRGIEGAAARAHFAALSHCVPASLQFTGRNRRPPRDPVNAALSLTYTMLHGEAVRALCVAGLDPALGFYHGLSYGRESLACDLVEAFRPRADYWVVRLFNRQVLRIDHFAFGHERSVDGACLLSKAGREQFYAAWELAAAPWRRGMRHIAITWAQQVLRDHEEGAFDDRPDNIGD